MTAGDATSAPAASARQPIVGDLVLAACLIVLAIFTSLVATSSETSGESDPSTWWEWILVVLPAIPVAFRRTAPLVATPISVLGQIILWGAGLATPFFAPLIMIYTVCADEGSRGRRLAIVSCVALIAMTMLGVFVAPDVNVDLLVFTSLASAMAFLLGSNAAQRRATEVRLAEDLAVARVERDQVQERAAANERQRIARELHDIVGHSLSVIAVRAEAADRVAPKNPGAAVDAVGAIATTARSSLAEVRRVLAGLREQDADIELAPLPSLASLPALAASFSDAGLAVNLNGDLPEDDAVGAAVGVGAYRIVQEALTNVLKHGGPQASAQVDLGIANAVLVVRIVDDGRGLGPESSETLGSGLAGMSERAEVLGGRLETGARAGGGYHVIATLPIDAAAAHS